MSRPFDRQKSRYRSSRCSSSGVAASMAPVMNRSCTGNSSTTRSTSWATSTGTRGGDGGCAPPGGGLVERADSVTTIRAFARL